MNKTLPHPFAFGPWSSAGAREKAPATPGGAPSHRSRSARATRPGLSTVVIVPDDRRLPVDQLAVLLPRLDADEATLVVAMIGDVADANRLRQLRRDASVVLAPRGTSLEDLRGLAMREATGDIVTLVDGAILVAGGDALAADSLATGRFA